MKKQQYSAERYEDLYSVDGERELREAIARNILTYGIKEQYAGRMLEVDGYGFFNSQAAASEAKKVRRAQDPTVIENRNIRNAERRIMHLIHANFPTGSLEMYLSYEKEPETPKDAERARNWFIDKLRKRYKAAGAELKYLYIEETHDRDGKPVRYHYHIFVNSVDGVSRDEVEDIWRARFGIANSTRLVENEFGLTGMSVYICKAPRKVKNRRRWACSRNLIQPEVHRTTRLPNGKTMTKKRMVDLLENRLDPREFFEAAYVGYRFIDIRAKRSDFVGGVYLYVRMRKIDESDNRTPSACAHTRSARTNIKSVTSTRKRSGSAGGMPDIEPDNRTKKEPSIDNKQRE